MSDKVIFMPGAEPLPENPVEVREIDPQRHLCSHMRIVLDVATRSVECNDCGTVLDAFDYLLQQGRMIQYAWTRHRQVERRIVELHTKVAELQRDEKRLKARVQRVKAKRTTLDMTKGDDDDHP